MSTLLYYYFFFDYYFWLGIRHRYSRQDGPTSQRRTHRLRVLSTRHARHCTEQHQLQQQQQCRYGQRTLRNRPPPLFPCQYRQNSYSAPV
jgi:hypothetical protein